MKTVLTLGCFDCLHPGHVAHLRKAAEYGRLVVGVTPDQYVGKGPGRPLFPLEQRIDMVAALHFVDSVYEVPHGYPPHLIHEIKPDVYIKGIEYKGYCFERPHVEQYGGEVIFLDVKPRYSSTKIMNGELLRERIGHAVESL